MTYSNRYTQILTTLFACYGQAGDAQRIAIYAAVLSTIMPPQVLDRVCKKVMIENRFMPTINEIVTAAKNITNNQTKNFDEAWNEIISNARHGTLPKAWSTPEIATLVKHFGWSDLINSQEAALPAIRAQMRGMYETICQRATNKVNNDYILGKADLLPDKAMNLLEGGTNGNTKN